VVNFDQTPARESRHIWRVAISETIMDISKNEKHKEYARYAAHCLSVVPAINGQDDAINREMAAEWLRLADAALFPLKRVK
jgi:hypothetical protein